MPISSSSAAACSAVNRTQERERLIAFYKAHNAEYKLGEVDTILNRYCGGGPERVEKMWRLLAEKYNPTPYASANIEVPMHASLPPATAPAPAAPTTSTTYAGQPSGVDSTAERSGFEPSYTLQPPDIALETERLIAFYKANDAEYKLGHVNATIKRFSEQGPDGLIKMWRLLAEKYNTAVPW